MASAAPRPRKKRPAAHAQPKAQKRKRDAEDFNALAARVEALDPQDSALKTFAALPLSQPTASGLHSAHFTTLTDIQRRAIPLALRGADVLGAAKTGSGKTLAFLVPVLENLYRERWTEHDGLGALILSPTRELAIQIFEVLRKIGRYHTFSAGLVIGGKSLQEERERLGRMNILVCTPGRMLQHLDQTAMFESNDLRMLVLDEADRILDMGFKTTVDAIVEHLPKGRQTLLFSATQTKRVSDLARLSLRDPEYVSVHQAALSATPAKLQQHYVVVPLPDKLDTLWSFLRANVKAKTLVFMSSGKQVRFVYESFRQMQPGVPLLHLLGSQKQTARLDIVTRFASSKHSCLFATDVVARGLDFPAVDWVIQLDCPEDADTYIHRVGRTARFEKDGRAVIFLEPREQEAMLKRLAQKKVPIEEIRIKAKKQQSIKGQLQNMCFRDPELKYLGQKAFISYAKSVHVQKDKEIFDIKALPLEEFSASLGLPGTPQIKFQKGDDAKARKNASRAAIASSDDEGAKPIVRTKYDRMFERVNQDVLAPHYTSMLENSRGGGGDESETEFLTVKRRLSVASASSSSGDEKQAEALDSTGASNGKTAKIALRANDQPLVIDSHRREKLLKSKKALLKFKDRPHKVVFDEDGRAREVYEMQDEAEFRAAGAAEAQRAAFVAAEQAALTERDAIDKQLQREKRRSKLEKRREREREMNEGGGREAELAPLDDEEEIGVDLDQLSWTQDEDGDEVDHSDDGDDGDGEAQSRGRRAEMDTKAAKKPEKKEKKWFQDSSDSEDSEPGDSKGKTKKRRKTAAANPAEVETLEDLEALAASYM